MDERVLADWDQQVSYKGKWWNEADPVNVFSGTLRFEDRSPQIEIESPPIGQEVYTIGRAATIHGELDSGLRVTLWGKADNYLNYDQEASNEARSIWHRTLYYAVLGGHLSSFEQTVFSYSALRLHGLAEWSRMDEPSPRGTPESELANYAPAFLANVRNADGSQTYSVQVVIEHPMRVQTDEHFPTGAIFEHRGADARVFFECTPPAPASFHALLALDLQALLVFSCQSAAPIEAEWLGIDDRNNLFSVSRFSSLNQGFKRNLSRKQMILSASSTPPDHLLPAWWSAIDELYPACQVVTIYYQGPHGVLEGSVALAVAATERIHEVLGSTETRFPNGFLPMRLEEILANYGGNSYGSFRQFLREAFRNNRPTLGTRLDEIIELVSSARLELTGINPGRWKDDAKLVRNKLAHSGSHVSRRDRDASELLDRVNVETRAILTLLIIARLGAAPLVLDEAAGLLKIDVERFRSNLSS